MTNILTLNCMLKIQLIVIKTRQQIIIEFGNTQSPNKLDLIGHIFWFNTL